MYQEFNCVNCQQRLRVRLENVGALTRCPHCETTQTAEARTTEQPTGFVAEPASAQTPPTTNPFAEQPVNPYRAAPVTSNPYVGPAYIPSSAFKELMERHTLARPEQRLFAAVIDWLFFFACLLPAFAIMAALRSIDMQLTETLGGFTLFGFWVGAQAVQAYLISTDGQSIGKKVMGIRIVTPAGFAPGFLYGIFLRQWLFAWIMPCYPVAAVVMLTDALFVFSQRRQCLHDLLANTYVVQA